MNITNTRLHYYNFTSCRLKFSFLEKHKFQTKNVTNHRLDSRPNNKATLPTR